MGGGVQNRRNHWWIKNETVVFKLKKRGDLWKPLSYIIIDILLPTHSWGVFHIHCNKRVCNWYHILCILQFELNQPATLLKVALHGCFSHILNRTNGNKSRKASRMFLGGFAEDTTMTCAKRFEKRSVEVLVVRHVLPR